MPVSTEQWYWVQLAAQAACLALAVCQCWTCWRMLPYTSQKGNKGQQILSRTWKHQTPFTLQAITFFSDPSLEFCFLLWSIMLFNVFGQDWRHIIDDNKSIMSIMLRLLREEARFDTKAAFLSNSLAWRSLELCHQDLGQRFLNQDH